MVLYFAKNTIIIYKMYSNFNGQFIILEHNIARATRAPFNLKNVKKLHNIYFKNLYLFMKITIL